MKKTILKINTSFLLLIIAAVFLGACDRKQGPTKEEVAAIKGVMEQRAVAIKNKDLELYKTLFLSDYNDGKANYELIIEEMAANFEQYESIEFTYQRSPVDLQMNSARMVGIISYKTNTMEKPVSTQEITLFRRVNDKWYISGGASVGLF